MTVSVFLLDAADNKDKELQKPAATAVTMATTAPVTAAPMLNVSNWKTSDIQNWLKQNSLKHLQTWYDTDCHRHLVDVVK